METFWRGETFASFLFVYVLTLIDNNSNPGLTLSEDAVILQKQIMNAQAMQMIL